MSYQPQDVRTLNDGINADDASLHSSSSRGEDTVAHERVQTAKKSRKTTENAFYILLNDIKQESEEEHKEQAEQVQGGSQVAALLAEYDIKPFTKTDRITREMRPGLVLKAKMQVHEDSAATFSIEGFECIEEHITVFQKLFDSSALHTTFVFQNVADPSHRIKYRIFMKENGTFIHATLCTITADSPIAQTQPILDQDTLTQLAKHVIPTKQLAECLSKERTKRFMVARSEACRIEHAIVQKVQHMTCDSMLVGRNELERLIQSFQTEIAKINRYGDCEIDRRDQFLSQVIERIMLDKQDAAPAASKSHMSTAASVLEVEVNASLQGSDIQEACNDNQSLPANPAVKTAKAVTNRQDAENKRYKDELVQKIQRLNSELLEAKPDISSLDELISLHSKREALQAMMTTLALFAEHPQDFELIAQGSDTISQSPEQFKCFKEAFYNGELEEVDHVEMWFKHMSNDEITQLLCDFIINHLPKAQGEKLDALLKMFKTLYEQSATIRLITPLITMSLRWAPESNIAPSDITVGSSIECPRLANFLQNNFKVFEFLVSLGLPFNPPSGMDEKTDATMSTVYLAVTRASMLGTNHPPLLEVITAVGVNSLKTLPTKALELLTYADSCGSLSAKYILGLCYLEGTGTKQNIPQAIELLKTCYLAGEQKIAIEQTLIDLVAHFVLGGDKIKQDKVAAESLLVFLAEQGSLDAAHRLYHIGVCYYTGQENYASNILKGTELLKTAAKFKSTDAVNYLKHIITKSKKSKKSAIKARGFELLQFLNDLSDMDAKHDLAVCHAKGLNTKVNTELAIVLFKQCCESGDLAITKLAEQGLFACASELYLGQECKQNIDEAIQSWLFLAKKAISLTCKNDSIENLYRISISMHHGVAPFKKKDPKRASIILKMAAKLHDTASAIASLIETGCNLLHNHDDPYGLILLMCAGELGALNAAKDCMIYWFQGYKNPKGKSILAPDIRKGLDFVKKTCLQNNLQDKAKFLNVAQTIGATFFAGSATLEKNLDAAIELTSLVAEQGHEGGLANLFILGRKIYTGCELYVADPNKGIRILVNAQRLGNKNAYAYLQALDSGVSATQKLELVLDKQTSPSLKIKLNLLPILNLFDKSEVDSIDALALLEKYCLTNKSPALQDINWVATKLISGTEGYKSNVDLAITLLAYIAKKGHKLAADNLQVIAKHFLDWHISEASPYKIEKNILKGLRLLKYLNDTLHHLPSQAQWQAILALNLPFACKSVVSIESVKETANKKSSKPTPRKVNNLKLAGYSPEDPSSHVSVMKQEMSLVADHHLLLGERLKQDFIEISEAIAISLSLKTADPRFMKDSDRIPEIIGAYIPDVMAPQYFQFKRGLAECMEQPKLQNLVNLKL